MRGMLPNGWLKLRLQRIDLNGRSRRASLYRTWSNITARFAASRTLTTMTSEWLDGMKTAWLGPVHLAPGVRIYSKAHRPVGTSIVQPRPELRLVALFAAQSCGVSAYASNVRDPECRASPPHYGDMVRSAHLCMEA